MASIVPESYPKYPIPSYTKNQMPSATSLSTTLPPNNKLSEASTDKVQDLFKEIISEK